MIPFRFFVFFILSLTFCCGFVHPKVPQAEGETISEIKLKARMNMN
ncbi:hypothetical protein CK203_110157 [Vitis vinifera]|uniref:Uncharacterized protein n=1 Tax=Vitis vinifera TaxID=29760 RepID=A0A438CPB2_VITVI|nr:hypothetical protein CK203_110157 [Vitis vinifera]